MEHLTTKGTIMTTTADTTTEPTTSTRPRRRTIIVAAAAALAATAIGAAVLLERDGAADHDDWVAPAAETATVIYEFHDAAVAPPYHRSYTITVTAGSAHAAVHNYDGVLAERTVEIDPAVWERTFADAVGYHDVASVTNDNCAGGTADELTVLDGTQAEAVHVYVSNCDTGDRPYLASVVGEAFGLLDLSGLLASVPPAE